MNTQNTSEIEYLTPDDLSLQEAIMEINSLGCFYVPGDDKFTAWDQLFICKQVTPKANKESTSKFEVKVAGPFSTRPGAKYYYDKVNKKFISWVDDQK